MSEIKFYVFLAISTGLFVGLRVWSIIKEGRGK